jgi:hypothetical protein
VFKYCALNRQKFLWFKTFEDMAKHFSVTESYLKLSKMQYKLICELTGYYIVGVLHQQPNKKTTRLSGV